MSEQVGQPKRRGTRATLIAALVIAAAFVIGATSCAGDAPDIPLGADGTPDAELVAGKGVWESSCARCHGADGGGGFGPRIGGRAQENLTDAELIDVISGGRKAMPAFKDQLSTQQIDAVVRFAREVL